MEYMYKKETGDIVVGFVVSLTLVVVVTAIIYFIRNLLSLSIDLQIRTTASNESLNDLLNSLPDSVLLLSEKKD
jgi:hypothetical protein